MTVIADRYIIAFLSMSLVLIATKTKIKISKNIWKLVAMSLFQPLLYFIFVSYGIKLTTSAFSSVMISILDEQEFQYRPKVKEIKGTVSSLRLDSLLALAFSSSRSKLVDYIENGKVFVNGKLITSNGYQIKENDIISVRGIGRFRFIENVSQTKKGRNYVVIELYV